MPHANGSKTPVSSPIRQVKVIVADSGDPGYTNRLMVGTATTGLVRVEWMAARHSQLVPLNWSMSDFLQVMGGYMPLRYQVADAQNLIVREAIKKDFEWLLLLEHDVVPPPDLFVRLNNYMRDGSAPIVSGLYFSRTYPSEPMVFRGMGQGAYVDWKFGDKVWCDGVPTGVLLVHMGIIRKMWDDSEEYVTRGEKTRKVFDTPRYSWYNPETDTTNFSTGTSDLEWCKRVKQGGYLGKAGWHSFEGLEYPFLVDTNIFCWHCNPDGTMFPDKNTHKEFMNG